ncbi:DIS3-like exonuclease 2 [Dirofilaria immitis]|nr:DIS3-like exonuclease 2 [Dirofilaria immitis]
MLAFSMNDSSTTIPEQQQQRRHYSDSSKTGGKAIRHKGIMSTSKKCIVPVARDTPSSRTLSFTTLTDGKEETRMSLSVEELALLGEIQRRGRDNSSGSVRTGKISVSELMGCGDKNADKRDEKIETAR